MDATVVARDGQHDDRLQGQDAPEVLVVGERLDFASQDGAELGQREGSPRLARLRTLPFDITQRRGWVSTSTAKPTRAASVAEARAFATQASSRSWSRSA